MNSGSNEARHMHRVSNDKAIEYFNAGINVFFVNLYGSYTNYIFEHTLAGIEYSGTQAHIVNYVNARDTTKLGAYLYG